MNLSHLRSILPTVTPRKIPGFIREPDSALYSTTNPLTDDEIIEAAKAIIARRFSRKTPAMTSPALMGDFLMLHFAGQPFETFIMLALDSQHRLIDVEELFRGTIDGASVYPREVVKAALAHNAAAVIFAHNHPSGVAEPSEADKIITQRLKTALAVVEIRTLDHFLVAGSSVVSFSERGLM